MSVTTSSEKENLSASVPLPHFTSKNIQEAAPTVRPREIIGHSTYELCCVGNNFCCDQCIWAPINPRRYRRSARKSWREQLGHSILFYFTIFNLTVMEALFLSLDAAYLAERIHLVVVAISVMLYLIVMTAFFTTACTDPGILPPSSEEEALRIEQKLKIFRWEPGTKFPSPRQKYVMVKDQPIRVRYCYTCRLFRLPRASHCAICNVCVDRFDHHCPWVGNCVGSRNYRYFFLFITSAASLGIYNGACACTRIIICVNSLLEEGYNPLIFTYFEFGVLLIQLWPIFGLIGYHCYLVMSNITTNEDVKGSFIVKRKKAISKIFQDTLQNPYTLGSSYLNLRQILFGARPKSRLGCA